VVVVTVVREGPPGSGPVQVAVVLGGILGTAALAGIWATAEPLELMEPVAAGLVVAVAAPLQMPLEITSNGRGTGGAE
tara:strand:- start:68 stop:301 length:234 start_codon:yes stop_codon:yes gene_type:complete